MSAAVVLMNVSTVVMSMIGPLGSRWCS